MATDRRSHWKTSLKRRRHTPQCARTPSPRVYAGARATCPRRPSTHAEPRPYHLGRCRRRRSRGSWRRNGSSQDRRCLCSRCKRRSWRRFRRLPQMGRGSRRRGRSRRCHAFPSPPRDLVRLLLQAGRRARSGAGSSLGHPSSQESPSGRRHPALRGRPRLSLRGCRQWRRVRRQTSTARLGERDKIVLVGNGDQGPADGDEVGGRGKRGRSHGVLQIERGCPGVRLLKLAPCSPVVIHALRQSRIGTPEAYGGGLRNASPAPSFCTAPERAAMSGRTAPREASTQKMASRTTAPLHITTISVTSAPMLTPWSTLAEQLDVATPAPLTAAQWPACSATPATAAWAACGHRIERQCDGPNLAPGQHQRAWTRDGARGQRQHRQVEPCSAGCEGEMQRAARL